MSNRMILQDDELGNDIEHPQVSPSALEAVLEYAVLRHAASVASSFSWLDLITSGCWAALLALVGKMKLQ